MSYALKNESLKFATVNTQEARDCAIYFKVTAIPFFVFFVNGKQHSTFTGADEGRLRSTLLEIGEFVSTRVNKHKELDFQQFKPNFLAPLAFNSMANLDKMKEFVTNFAKSPEALKDVKDTTALVNWLGSFKLEKVPSEALDQLMGLVEIAEDKSKIALIDLTRLLLCHEPNAAYLLNKHWSIFEVAIFGYIQCMDIKDPEAKVMHNYHLICLKMLGNIFQTQAGNDFISGADRAASLLDFCVFSFASVNPKVVTTASQVYFNHLLAHKSDNETMQRALNAIG